MYSLSSVRLTFLLGTSVNPTVSCSSVQTIIGMSGIIWSIRLECDEPVVVCDETTAIVSFPRIDRIVFLDRCGNDEFSFDGSTGITFPEVPDSIVVTGTDLLIQPMPEFSLVTGSIADCSLYLLGEQGTVEASVEKGLSV